MHAVALACTIAQYYDSNPQTNAFATAPNAETKTDDKYSQLVATNLLNLSSDDAVSNNVNTPETTAPMSLSNDSGVATTVGVASRSRSRTAKAPSTSSSTKIDDIDDIAADNSKTALTKVPAAAAAAATVSLTILLLPPPGLECAAYIISH